MQDHKSLSMRYKVKAIEMCLKTTMCLLCHEFEYYTVIFMEGAQL